MTKLQYLYFKRFYQLKNGAEEYYRGELLRVTRIVWRIRLSLIKNKES